MDVLPFFHSSSKHILWQHAAHEVAYDAVAVFSIIDRLKDAVLPFRFPVYLSFSISDNLSLINSLSVKLVFFWMSGTI